MAETPKHHGKDWTSTENRELKKLIGENTPTRVIASKLGRTPGAVRGHASDLGLSMKAVNRRPNKSRKQ
jgi:hypothetical protein